MLSRRNIRIKVMQLLFSLNKDEKPVANKVVDKFETYVKKSFELYLFNLYVLTEVCQYAKKDEEKRHGKYLPTPEDLLFRAKLLENDCTQSLIRNRDLKGLFQYHKFEEFYDTDLSRKLYFEYSKTDEYKDYVYNSESTEIHDIKALLELYKSCIKNELCAELMEDHYSNLTDDKSLVVGVMKKTIKSLPVEGLFFNDYKPAEEAVNEFGNILLHDVIEQDERLLGMIEPVLKNWDADRVANIDMILLKMAISEMILFPTIPTTVTINEYIEISKMYSTEKSKDFINGVLERMVEVLKEQGKLNKTGRGLGEELSDS
ncbi:MAG: transcription antitermination factor NusB [Saprospiraceae bacterium]|nr:transcription antitermination factor NusB [Saprospiraceae bacterium]